MCENKMSKEEILRNLEGFTGTEKYWNLPELNFNYTDGVKFVKDACECVWLLVDIYIFSKNTVCKEQEFQSWVLERVEGNSFVLKCHDGNNNYFFEHTYIFSDFPLDRINIFYRNGVMFLPSEN